MIVWLTTYARNKNLWGLLLPWISEISLRTPFSHALLIDWDSGKCVPLLLLHSSMADNSPKIMPGSFCLSLWHFCFAVPGILFCFYHDIEHLHEFAECYIINIMMARPNSVCFKVSILLLWDMHLLWLSCKWRNAKLWKVSCKKCLCWLNSYHMFPCTKSIAHGGTSTKVWHGTPVTETKIARWYNVHSFHRNLGRRCKK